MADISWPSNVNIGVMDNTVADQIAVVSEGVCPKDGATLRPGRISDKKPRARDRAVGWCPECGDGWWTGTEGGRRFLGWTGGSQRMTTVRFEDGGGGDWTGIGEHS